MEDISIVGKASPLTIGDQHGNLSLNMDSSRHLPRIGGALNYMRLLQFTPGVAATAEGAGNIMVRGGDYGQNRIILNGAPLYTPSHLLGFMPILNSSYLDNLTLVKSNIPAEYGSAASSVIDIKAHTTLPERLTFDINLGIISSDATLQLPLGEKCALFASARRSYASWLMRQLNVRDSSIDYEFKDYELGLVADLGPAGLLNFNTHYNYDAGLAHFYQYSVEGKFDWWNSASSAVLTTPLGDNMVMENTIYASLYNSGIDIRLVDVPMTVGSILHDYGFRNISTFEGEQAEFSWGADYAYRTIVPQYIHTEQLNTTPSTDTTHEMSLFASAEWEPLPIMRLYTGIRMSLYRNDRSWFYPEPRLMLTFPITPLKHLTVNYNMMVQYLQLIPQSNTSLASDFYIGAMKGYEPQRSHNFAVGYKERNSSGSLSWSVEGFYRRMYGVVEFDRLVTHLISESYNYNNYVHIGQGEAYGLESSLSYIGKNYTLRANYTLGKSLRQIEGFNNDKVFPANSDRRHTLSVLATYEPSPRWILSTTFVYASGAPYTAPTAIYTSGGTIIAEYSSYNGARLDAIHHLDLSVSYCIPSKMLRENTINISLYNAYAHRNPLMTSWEVTKPNSDSNDIRIKERIHYLYTFLPSISWTLKF